MSAIKHRLFSALQVPAGLHLAAFTFVGALVIWLVVVPGDELHRVLGFSMWQHVGISSARVTQGMVWLLFANVVSVVAVVVLLSDLWSLGRGCMDLKFRINSDRAKERCGLRDTSLKAAQKRPARWATQPLTWTYRISMSVLLVMAVVFIITVFKCFPVVTDGLFVALTLMTGLGYLGAMTIGDFCAQAAYKRCTCLTHQWNQDDSEEDKDRRTVDFDMFMNTLSDYSIIIRYVDLPILASLLLITVHKLWTLGVKDAYHFGFVSGAIAMHVIIANIISLIIVTVRTRVVSEAV